MKNLKFSLEKHFSVGIMSYYVLTDMDYNDFDLTDAWDFLEEKLDEETYAKLEFIEEEESVAQYYNYRYCLVFHDTAKVEKSDND